MLSLLLLTSALEKIRLERALGSDGTEGGLGIAGAEGRMMLGTSPPSSHVHIGVVMDATGGRSRSRAVLGRKNRVLSDGRSKKPSLADAKTCLL